MTKDDPLVKDLLEKLLYYLNHFGNAPPLMLEDVAAEWEVVSKVKSGYLTVLVVSTWAEGENQASTLVAQYWSMGKEIVPDDLIYFTHEFDTAADLVWKVDYMSGETRWGWEVEKRND